VRFDSARAAGLTESRVACITDDYEAHLSEKETAALQLVAFAAPIGEVNVQSAEDSHARPIRRLYGRAIGPYCSR